MSKFYIDETNLGQEATEGQARQLITILQEQGWSVEYGSSIDDEATEDEALDFEAAFYQALAQVAT